MIVITHLIVGAAAALFSVLRMRLAPNLKLFSSFTVLAELFIVVYFVDCSLFSVGICNNIKLLTGSLYYPNFQLYRLFTFLFVNTNLILFLFDVSGYLIFEATVERRWNFVEKVKFLLITTWLPAFMCLIYYYIKFAQTRTEADLYYTGVYGSSSFVAAVTVVHKQLRFDPSSTLKYQLIHRSGPVVYLALIAFLQLLHIIPEITFFYSFGGFLFGWVYLRFIQKHTDGKRGDFRGCFAFSSFFPRILQPFIAIFANCIYALFVILKVCPKMEQQYEILSASSFSKDVPTVSCRDNERHKRIALQDLNARLAKKQEPLQEWPTLFEDEKASTATEGSDARSSNLATTTAGTSTLSAPPPSAASAVATTPETLPNV